MVAGACLLRTERIRVLRIITRLNIGGPALHVGILSTRLDTARFETLLIAGREGPSEGSMESLGRLTPDLPLRRVGALGREVSPVDDLTALWEITRIAREFKPHVVHTHLAKAGALGRVAARLAGVRTVFHTYHGTVFRGHFGSRRSRLFLEIERILARATTGLIAITAGQKAELLSLGLGTYDTVREIPLGLDLGAFLTVLDGQAARAALRLPADAHIVSVVARLVPVKDVATLIRAVALLPENTHLMVVGDGEERTSLEECAKALGVASRCHFLGWRADVAQVYAASDIVALSSLSEGSPVSLIEAMAAGRCVVATAVGGVPDVVQDGVSGLLAPPSDPPALSRALAQALADPQLRKRLGTHGRAAVIPRFDASRLVADIEQLYVATLTHNRR